MVGAAADPCRAGRAAGAACFASFMGLKLKKYLFKKKNKNGFGFVSVLGHYRDRCVWAGKLRLKRAVDHRVRSALVALRICLSFGSKRCSDNASEGAVVSPIASGLCSAPWKPRA